ncbi:hypothetical protein DB88DRAFT_482662 [Papiliotrema laurentii]|uniref:Transcription and mRNA export factor SUS1 n=1 Tax=Papiliotrema laurentii TaxID=5418 RepID=A0AAD9L8U8_PAPLA|nr:hypothetical protein DB88DRAFT_482662 [Papiliotrema laurentii]
MAAEAVAKASSGAEDVQAALKKRLIETGDWDRISTALQRYLVEQGIEDDMKIRAEDIIKDQENPTLWKVKDQLLANATDMIPPDIQRAVKQEIEAALERQLQ